MYRSVCVDALSLLVSFPEVVDVIVDTLQGVFTQGVCSSSLSRP